MDTTPNEAAKANPHRKGMDELLAKLLMVASSAALTSEQIDPYLRKAIDDSLARVMMAGPIDDSLARVMMAGQLDPFMRAPAVAAAIGVSVRTLYRMVKAGTFPAPKRLGPNSVGWRTSTPKRWNDSRPAAREAA